MIGNRMVRVMAVVVAMALGLWVSPALAGKLALNDAELDGVTAGGQSTIIQTGEGSPVDFVDNSQFNLNFDVPDAQAGMRALTIQNVVGELQLLVNLNVLSANGNVAETDQRNFSLQSWGGTLPIAGTGLVATVSGVSAAPCTGSNSCTSTGGAGAAPSSITAGGGGNAASTAAADAGGAGGAGGISSPATVSGSANGAQSGTPLAPIATAGVGATATPNASVSLPACTTGCTAVPVAVGIGGGGGDATAVSKSGNGGDGGTLVAKTGNGGDGGNGGNAAAAAAAAPGGNGASVTAAAGNAGAGGTVTVGGSASTSPGIISISPTASASGDLVITSGNNSKVSANDDSQFTLNFTASQAQNDLSALFISNVVGRSQMALNLNIASSQFNMSPFQTDAIQGNVTGTIKQVNTGIQFRGTPLVGATGVTTGLNMTINHQNQ